MGPPVGGRSVNPSSAPTELLRGGLPAPPLRPSHAGPRWRGWRTPPRLGPRRGERRRVRAELPQSMWSMPPWAQNGWALLPEFPAS
eukprot:6395018-Pyramimonas_sp.AAC.1